jgi:hypothetical protein
VRWSALIWLLVILGLAAYIAADAAFDVSKKISRFIRFGALPWIRSAWGAVVGRRPVGKERLHTDAAPADSPPVVTETVEAPMRLQLDWGQALSFLWKAKWLILFLSIFVVGVGAVRGCTPPFAKSRDTLRAELKEARTSEAVTRHEALIASKAIELSEQTHTDRSRRAEVIAQAEQEIEDAVSQADFDRLYLAYRRAYDSVWDNAERSDSPNPNPSGVAPVRRSGASDA